MIKILKSDNVYRRDREFAELSFRECTKITTNRAWSKRATLLQSFCIVAVVDGSFEISVNRQNVFTLEEGSVLVLSPNTSFGASAISDTGALQFVFFDCDDFLFFELPDGFKHTRASSNTLVMLDLLGRGLSLGEKPLYACEAALVLILEEIKRRLSAEPNKRAIYDEVCRYVAEHVTEELSVEKISRAMNYSADYLSRTVRECAGVGLCRLITEERLGVAKGLLKMTEYSCEKIAKSIGLSSGNKFVKFFKYHTGESPSEYRSRTKGVL